jgi:two-component system chemotaxis response regulator CheB
MAQLDHIRVMLVDDSAMVRGLMQRALKAEALIDVVAVAANGALALETLKKQPVDVIVLDIEMPVMDGLAALPELLKISPRTKVIMASTLTMRNAEISFRALQLGATEYLPKPSSTGKDEVEEFYRLLIDKIKALGQAKESSVRPAAAKPSLSELPPPLAAASKGAPSVIPAATIAEALKTAPPAMALAVASSTGGPQALLTLFAALKGKIQSVPIFVTQHMPPNFTTILAEHISKTIEGDCHEARDGEAVYPGIVYLAPGNYHMVAERQTSDVVLRVNQAPPENFCRPAADPMLRSLAVAYGNALVVAVLTGMGSDGARGAVDVVNAGGTVVAQDEPSCVVYGMPKAVVDRKLVKAILPLDQIAPYFMRSMGVA